MKKKPSPKPGRNNTKKRILKFLNEIDWFFGLNGHTKSIIYPKEDFKVGDDQCRQADIKVDNQYRDVEIKIYPNFFRTNSCNQRKILLHELCHSITHEFKDIAYDLYDGKFVTPDRIKFVNESTTSQIENMLDGLLQNRTMYAKRAYKNYLK